MKIVIDTNVVASAIFFGGKPRKLIECLFNNRAEAYVTREIISEYSDTVNYLINKYPKKPLNLPLAFITSCMNIIETKSDVNVCRDPDDNKFIECAMDAKCVYVVSGDKDLLDIKAYKGVEIITVAEFLKRL